MLFTPSMASILMALPREKKSTLTAKEIGQTVGLLPSTVNGGLRGLNHLGLVLKQGKAAPPDADSRWQLSANGLKVVKFLVGAV